MKNVKTEVLSPAGTYEAVISALNAGCDAIYLGGQDFNARNSNQNFSNKEIEEIVELCAIYSVKVNLTVNTLIKDSEYNDLIRYLDKMYKIGINAFIIQDISLLSLIRSRYKDIKVHASTQMSAHSLLDVLHLKKLGFDRVVLARECSFDEIKTIKENVDIELEVFVHGALCVSYSGQCLMSSLIGGRSGNRGRCAQPCRKTLSLVDTSIDESVMEGYLLSPKDISQVDNIDRLLEIGIDSIKIEGRMKSPAYVYKTTKVYRDKINSIVNNTEFDEKSAKKDLLTVFNRGGSHSKGYLDTHSSFDMMSIETPKASGTFLGIVTDYNKVTGKCVIKLQDDVVCGDGIEIWTKNKQHVGTNISKDGRASQSYLVKIDGKVNVGDKVYKSFNKKLTDTLKPKGTKLSRKIDVEGTFKCLIDKPFEFTVTYNNITITKYGDIVTENSDMPLSAEVIIEKLSKTGSTPFTLNIGEYEIGGFAFTQLKNINEIRRSMFEALEEEICQSVKKFDVLEYKKPKLKSHFAYGENVFSVYLENIHKLDEIIDCKFERLYIPFDNGLKTKIKPIINLCREYLKDIYIVLPTITSTETEILIDGDIDELKKLGVNGFVVSNYGQMLMCQDSDLILNTNFNVLNKNSVEYLQSLDDVYSVSLSQEATLEEIIKMENIDTEVTIHGRAVVMETRACPIGIYLSNKNDDKFCAKRNKTSNFVLRDKMKMDFPIKTDCTNCICQIYNSNVLFMMDKFEDLRKLKSSLRINITTEENPKEIIDGYINSINNNDSLVFDIKDNYNSSITKGHFYRGVQ